MSVFMDLNLRPTAERSTLQSLLDTAAHLGYSAVAINYVFEPTSKKKQEIPKPTPTSELFDKLPTVQGRSRPIRVLNRLTIVASDASHFRPSAPEFRSFDLLAIHPTSEKLFHAACMTFDVDIICVTVTEKLPFFFKRAPVSGAVERGLVFELCYVPAIRDSTTRRYTIANAVCLLESCKGRNVILSSGAEKPLELRGPYDIANLGLLFGLSEGDAKEAVSSTCRSAVLHGVHTLQVSADTRAPASCCQKPGRPPAAPSTPRDCAQAPPTRPAQTPPTSRKSPIPGQRLQTNLQPREPDPPPQ
ncbi:ribonuclease P protein subunit p30 isoform X3 [Myripristis murdjan]|uniref:ribonuclease P protein subunit p30 isoform X3 n=1 Tax=Myripristis murdjan TaxID=586833 RepID=UPI001175EF58|nr:ribonuclease P protein subunit p30 isoform X3 [Myripristis murdjan]